MICSPALSLSLSVSVPLSVGGFATRAPHSKVKHVSRWAHPSVLRPHSRLFSAAPSSGPPGDGRPGA